MEKQPQSTEAPEMSAQEACNRIMAMSHLVQKGGRHDQGEVKNLIEIAEEVRSGKITPVAGLEKANAALDQRQDDFTGA